MYQSSSKRGLELDVSLAVSFAPFSVYACKHDRAARETAAPNCASEEYHTHVDPPDDNPNKSHDLEWKFAAVVLLSGPAVEICASETGANA